MKLHQIFRRFSSEIFLAEIDFESSDLIFQEISYLKKIKSHNPDILYTDEIFYKVPRRRNLLNFSKFCLIYFKDCACFFSYKNSIESILILIFFKVQQKNIDIFMIFSFYKHKIYLNIIKQRRFSNVYKTKCLFYFYFFFLFSLI